jgi:methyl-accepting chemotaxis protein/methyl-accepting chemotaxis protein-1 (serine sensor receptor)
MTIGKKLGLGFGGIVALLAIMGWSALNTVGNLAAALDREGTRGARKLELAGNISSAASEMAAAERGMLLLSAGDAAAHAQEEKFNQVVALIRRSAGEYRNLAVLEQSKRLLDSIDRRVGEWSTTFSQVAELSRTGNHNAAVKLFSERDTAIYDSISSDIGQMIELQKKLTAEDVAEGAAMAATSRWTAIALIVVALVLGAIVLMIVRQTNESLRKFARMLGDAAGQVSSAAAQVSSASQSLAQGASEQAASLEETSASSEEISTMTRCNAEHAEEAARLMVATTDSESGANVKMDQMQVSMTEITASSGKISRIIKVIDEIAFQTNILALNAAVEAARAGQAGLGFAVVADEVRNLAQRCAEAARNTAELIEESIARSNDGGMRMGEVSQAIGAITGQSAQVKALVDQIHTGSQEQARGIEQVAGAVAQMQQLTQSTAASAEQTAAAGNELSAHATSLNHVVSELNALVGRA